MLGEAEIEAIHIVVDDSDDLAALAAAHPDDHVIALSDDIAIPRSFAAAGGGNLYGDRKSVV